MLAELDITHPHYQHLEYKWPNLYVLINLLVRQKLIASRHKVDHSTLAAAVAGDSRDRRLYYELIGEMKREPASPGEKGIVFVNNILVRPASGDGPVVVEAEAGPVVADSNGEQ